jgi:hypothetical protein
VESEKNDPAKTSSATIPLSGPPGLPTFLVVQNVFQDGDPRNLGGPGGSPGQYRVVLTLGRPGFALRPETSFTFESGLEGDSHLAICPPALRWEGADPPVAIHVRTVTPSGELVFRGVPNKKGFLGKLVVDGLASTDLKSAYRKAIGAIGSFLSTTSVYSDIPLSIFQADVTELRTGNSALLHVNPHRDAIPGRLPEAGLSADYRLYASLYREALNSNSGAYQFLCLFKIVEGIRTRHERRVAEARKSGAAVPTKPREAVPDSPEEQKGWLNSIFPQAPAWDQMTIDATFPPESVGKKVNRIVDDYLSPIRTRIAHAFLDSGEATFSIDDETERDAINHWLPLLKCIARLLLKNEFPEAFSR